MVDPNRIWSSSSLPSLPVVAVRLLELTRNPETDIRSIADVVKTDPAIAAKILKAVNSTFFGFSSRVTTIDRAIPLLGTTVVTSLALSFSLIEAARGTGPAAKHFQRYWLQSMVQASAAEILGGLADEGLACEYFLAGLLMDLGRLAMLKTVGDQFIPVLDAADAAERPVWELSRETLGLDHIQVGHELMQRWNLPETLRQAIALHHEPLERLRQAQNEVDFALLKALSVAGAVGHYYCTSARGYGLSRARELLSEFYAFGTEQQDEFLARVHARLQQSAEIFSVNVDDLGDPADLMARANEQLAALALRASVESAQAQAQKEVVEKEKEQLIKSNQELQKQALHDPLTRVYNRSFFEEALLKETQRCCRYAAPLGVIFTDVDRFKSINDTYGHQFGDLVLKRVAACIGDVLRSADTLARYGGEEFVILVSQPTEKGLQKLAERVRERVEAEDIYHGKSRIPVTASVGAALTIPRRNDEGVGARLVEAADQAMYEAKQGGRNQVRCRLLLEENERRLIQSVTARRFSRWLVAHGHLDMTAVSRALVQLQAERSRVGELACQLGWLTPEQIDQVVAEQEQSGRRFCEAARDLGLLDEARIIELLALQQENPVKLAAVLSQLGMLDPRRSAALVLDHRAAAGITAPATATA